MCSHGNSTFGATTLFYLPSTRPSGNNTFGAIRMNFMPNEFHCRPKAFRIACLDAPVATVHLRDSFGPDRVPGCSAIADNRHCKRISPGRHLDWLRTAGVKGLMDGSLGSTTLQILFLKPLR
jgi:hypothetical protein